MPALFINILKLAFLGLIYLFLWQVARSLTAHLGITPSLRRSRAEAEIVVVRSDVHPGVRFPVSGVVVVGRSPDADVTIEDPYASDQHFRFTLVDGRVILQDLGSTNGTYVNGRRVTDRVELSRGDAVQIGKTIMEVR